MFRIGLRTIDGQSTDTGDHAFLDQTQLSFLEKVIEGIAALNILLSLHQAHDDPKKSLSVHEQRSAEKMAVQILDNMRQIREIRYEKLDEADDSENKLTDVKEAPLTISQPKNYSLKQEKFWKQVSLARIDVVRVLKALHKPTNGVIEEPISPQRAPEKISTKREIKIRKNLNQAKLYLLNIIVSKIERLSTGLLNKLIYDATLTENKIKKLLKAIDSIDSLTDLQQIIDFIEQIISAEKTSINRNRLFARNPDDNAFVSELNDLASQLKLLTASDQLKIRFDEKNLQNNADEMAEFSKNNHRVF